MIKNVIFDFGGVIGDFNEKYILSGFFDTDGDIDDVSSAIFENWELLDRGAVAYGDYIDSVLEKISPRLQNRTRSFFADWYKRLPYVEGIERTIEELKKSGRRLYLLSNAPSYLSEHRDYFAVFKQFDGLIFSGDVKLLKPDKRIYELLLSEFSLNPRECVFADDRPENIEAARLCKIDGYLFRGDAEDFLKYVKKGCRF